MKKLTFLLFALFYVVTAYSAYLRNVPVELKQPDGSVIQCFITGDEFHRRVHDKNNYTIVQSPETGFYVYALKIGEELVASEWVVGKSDPKGLGMEPNVDIPVQKMEDKRENVLKSAKITTTPHTKGNFYNLVVFVRFADDEEFEEKLENYNTLFNNEDTIANSVFAFYHKSSDGQLKVYSKFYPGFPNEAVISYKDQNERNYYKAFSINNSLGFKNETERNEREQLLIENAINSIKSSIPGSELLDGNDDGSIDNVCFIIKGFPDTWGHLLWPHMSTYNLNNVSINGKNISTYNIQIEDYIIIEGNRVLCHELFHSMGAPDLYRYYDKSIDPVGSWDLMGSYDGQYLSTYMKWKYGKWFDILPEITQAGTYALQPISKKPFSCFKIPSPISTTEYFIAEYRESEGLLIYRINSNINGNAYGPPDELYVYRPSGTLTQQGFLFDAAFSQQNNHVLFNSETNPSCFLSDGSSGQIDISNIGVAKEDISFTVNEFNPLPQPRRLSGETKNSQLVFYWNSPFNKGELFKGYNLYTGNNITPLNTTIITDTTFIASLPEIDSTYMYRLVAIYTNGMSSPISTMVTTENNNISNTKWANYTSGSIIKDIAQEGNYLWVAGGGLTKVNTITGETINYNHANSGLLENDVTAVNVDHFGNKWIGLYNGDLIKFDGTNWTTYKTPALSCTIMDIAIDSKNIIWIATWSGGLLRFDGNEWKVFRTDNSGLPETFDRSMDNYIYCTTIDNDDNLWIGLKDNLAKFDGTTWTAYNSTNSELPGIAVTSIAIDSLGNKWIGTAQGGVVKFDDSTWIKTELANGYYADVIAIDKNDNKWVGCSNGSTLFKITNEGIQEYEFSVGILSILTDQNNNVWIGTFGNGLGKFNDNELHFHKTGNSDLSYDRTWSIFFQKNGIKWFGTEQKGAVKYDGVDWESFEMHSNPLFTSIPGVMKIKDDNKGNTWFATEQGIVRYDGNDLEFFTPQNTPLPDYKINTIQIDKNGIIWFGTQNGLVAYDGLNWKVYNSSNLNLLSNEINALNIDKENNLWIGYTNMGGVTKFNGISCISYKAGVNGPLTKNTKELFFDNEGNLWVAGWMCSGVSKFNGISWSYYGNLFNISTVRQDSNNQLWFGGYYRGLITLKNSQWITYDIYNSKIPSNMVTTLEIDSLGNKWIGTYGGGVGVFNEQGVKYPLLASAGPNRLVYEETMVSLNGKASENTNGNKITYKWTSPEEIILSSDTIATPSFKAPKVDQDTRYTFLLVISDGTIKSPAAKVTITVKPGKEPPIANAGYNQVVYEGDLVSLYAGSSYDPNGNKLTYNWVSSGPIILSSNTTVNPNFVAPTVESESRFTFSLTVDNGTTVSLVDQVTITVRKIKIGNIAPVAYAGYDKSVDERTVVTLDGMESFDEDGYALTYKWTAPEGFTLSTTDSQKPTFIAPQVSQNTNYIFSLVVNDGIVDSPPDQVVITIKDIDTINKIPKANAGSDLIVDEGSSTLLDGTESFDPNNNVLNYLWHAPSGINIKNPMPSGESTEVLISPEAFINFSSDGLLTKVFTAKEGTKVFLTFTASDRKTHTFSFLDKALENIFVNFSRAEGGKSITFLAPPMGSYDFIIDGTERGTMIIESTLLSLSNTSRPSFNAPIVNVDTTFILSLIVNNGTCDSPVDELVVTVRQTNKVPVSNAGADQIVYEGATVSLDGSLSSDPDENNLTYKWTAPSGITLSSAFVTNPTFTAPEVIQDTSFTFSLVVNDGKMDSPTDQVTITVNQLNNSPTANAGIDQTVYEGAIVTLDGSLSSDLDGNNLTYIWTAPSEITLNSMTAVIASFTAPEVAQDTPYTFSLVVNDELVDSPIDQVTIMVKQANKTPVANAGVDQTVNEGTTITLDGSLSSDPDGNNYTYKWTAPVGIILSSTTIAKPTFTTSEISVNTNYTFTLVVNDGTVESPVDQVVITVQNINKIPVAFAGIDQFVNEGTIVSLDGSASSDPDGDLLIYNWNSPVGIPLSSTTADRPTFLAPEVKSDSVLNFSLLVNDGVVNSLPATVKVAVLNNIKVDISIVEFPMFKFFPNPTTGVVNLKIAGATGRETEVWVTNVVGAEVFRKEITDASQFQVDLSNQIDGIYLLKAISDNQLYISKIVVRKE